MSKIDLQRAYILHQYPFKETSAILECFTEEQGRISIIAKGIRRTRQIPAQLFTEYWVKYANSTELKYLYQLEYTEPQLPLQGMALSCGFYLNELLLHFLPKDEVISRLWHYYQHTLNKLRLQQPLSPLMREFEFELLTELGYGLHLKETYLGEPLQPEASYLFEFGRGLELHSVSNVPMHKLVFTGAELLAVDARDWSYPNASHVAKQLLRQAIDQLLEGKTLKSREFARFLQEISIKV